MTPRSRIWFPLAVLFVLANVGGFVFAANQEEMTHAAVHAVLAVLGTFVAFRMAARRSPDAAAGGTMAIPFASAELDDRLTHLEHSVEAVAIEVERIGEGQRYMTRLVGERAAPQGVRGETREPDAAERPPLRKPLDS